jgi:hypothetical protein
MTLLSGPHAAGRRRSPATLPGYHAGRPPRTNGMRYPADLPTIAPSPPEHQRRLGPNAFWLQKPRIEASAKTQPAHPTASRLLVDSALGRTDGHQSGEILSAGRTDGRLGEKPMTVDSKHPGSAQRPDFDRLAPSARAGVGRMTHKPLFVSEEITAELWRRGNLDRLFLKNSRMGLA